MGGGQSDLSNFRKAKLLHEYYAFYDLNQDKSLTWTDFDLARQHMCTVTGWQKSDERYLKTQEIFIDIWNSITKSDSDLDGTITEKEWLEMWDNCEKKQTEENKNAAKENREPKNMMPPWMEPYIETKFNMYDKSGNNVLDGEEFQKILAQFKVPAEDAEECFKKISKDNTKPVDLEYFKQLCHEYYLSDDTEALGNFVNGKVKFEYTPAEKK